MASRHSKKKLDSTPIPAESIVDQATFAMLFSVNPADLRKAPLKDVLADTKAGQAYYNLLPAIAALVNHLVETRIPEGEGALNTMEGIKLKTARLDYEKKLRDQQQSEGKLLERSDAQMTWAMVLGQILQAHEDFFNEIIEDSGAPPDIKHELSVKNANFRNQLASENWAEDMVGDELDSAENE